MAGICLCRYNDCPKNGSCKRFLIEANDMSSFAEFQYICNEENNYQYYWRNVSDIVEVKDNGAEGS